MPEEKLDNIIKVIDLLEKIKAKLTCLIQHSGLINESLQEMIGDVKTINLNMREAALGLKVLAAEAMKDDQESAILDKKADAVQAANDAVPVIRPWAAKAENEQSDPVSFRPAGI
jgi:hypothetical protein